MNVVLVYNNKALRQGTERREARLLGAIIRAASSKSGIPIMGYRFISGESFIPRRGWAG